MNGADPPTNKRSFLRDSLGTIGGRSAVLAFTALTHVALARLLGPSGRGVFAALIVVPMLYASVVQQGGQRAIARSLATQPDKQSRLLGVAGFLIVVASIVGGVIVFLSGLLTGMLAEHGLISVSISATIIPSMLCLTLGQGFYLGYNDFLRLNRASVYAKAITFTLMVLLLPLGFGVSGALVAFSLGFGAVGLFVLWGLVRRVSPRAFSRSTLRAVLSLGLLFSGAQLFMHLNLRVDVLMLSMLVPPKGVGLYAVAGNAAELLLAIPASVGAVLFARRAAQDKVVDRKQQLVRGVRVGLSALVLAAVALMSTAWIVIPAVFGEAYASASPMVLILGPGVVVLGLFKMLYGELTGQGSPWSAIGILATGALLNVVVNLVLIPTMGPVGAATSSTLSYICVAALIARRCLRDWNLTAKELLQPTTEDWQLLWGRMRLLISR